MNKYIIILALFTVSCAQKVDPTYGVEGNYTLDYEIVNGVTKDINSIYSLEIDEDNFIIHSDTSASTVSPYYTVADSLYIQASNGLIVHHYYAYKEYLELTRYYDSTLIKVFCKRI